MFSNGDSLTRMSPESKNVMHAYTAIGDRHMGFLSSSTIPRLVPESESDRGFDLVLVSEKGSSECVVNLTALPRNCPSSTRDLHESYFHSQSLEKKLPRREFEYNRTATRGASAGEISCRCQTLGILNRLEDHPSFHDRPVVYPVFCSRDRERWSSMNGDD